VHGIRGPGYVAWRASNVVAQVHDGYAAVVVRLVLGDFTAQQARSLAKIAREFGDGVVRATLEQNLLMQFVPVEDLPALHVALEAEGLARSGARTVVDVTTCPGAESCQLAVTASRQLGVSISERLESMSGEAARALDLASTAAIKISGCPNSCGQHHVADLGFHGAVRKIGDRSAPVYQLHLGGGVDGVTGATFGRQVIKIPARRVAEAVERLVLLFARERQGDETPRAFYRRVAADRVQSLLGDLATLDANSAAEEFTDLGQDTGFVVAIGTGECAA
jgi:sulfite reductase beta subunit-like hemoprotein